MATTTTADGTSISFDDSGTDGDAVVLVHGITECRDSWAPVTERLVESNRVIALDLRGHGASGEADRYDLEAMAGDVATVIAATDVERPHLVGHSLGGAVVSAVGAALPVASITNVDQSLQLGDFKSRLTQSEEQLRDPEAFPFVISAMFEMMSGPLAETAEFARVNRLRRANQQVVLGVWDMVLTMPEDDLAAVVEVALAGYAGVEVPYLSVFGIDPGEGYGDWIAGHIAGAVTEVWPDHGHYPHLVDPDRFVDRLRAHWSPDH